MFLEIIKKMYRLLVPLAVRKTPMAQKLKTRFLGHDGIYNADFYAQAVEGPAVHSAGRIADTIINEFKGSSVVDVGCGTGALLAALREGGCRVFGLEYSDAALKYCRSRGLSVEKFNLERDVFKGNRTFDVAISMEVAEHLPDRIADRYIDLLAQLSPVIIFTAAPPGQGGTNHVNEQPAGYWISKFRKREFTYLGELTSCWREQWKAAGDVESWYYDNLMIFRQRMALQGNENNPSSNIGDEI